MFSLLQVSLHGFLQCSIFFPQDTVSIFAFKSVAETIVLCCGVVSESKTLYVKPEIVGL